jgi:hypothetical protein
VPCSPSDVAINAPSNPSGPAIPGIGIPHALKLPNLIPDIPGTPEDLLALLNDIQMIIPPGILKPQLPFSGKSVYDAIMKLIDQFLPFLMMYKMFLPVLQLIICIIEILCSLSNPVRLAIALSRLFRVCLPPFLNLFPIFAIIVMLISLLLLLLALIEYLITQILNLINALLKNINALVKAFENADENSVLAAAKKIGSLLCIFQNFFVLLSIVNDIIEIIKDIISLLFSLPPCSSGNDSNCCSPEVCPAIVKTQYTRSTATFQYLSEIGFLTTVSLPPPINNLTIDLRSESWQLYDTNQEIAQAFSNIYDAYDVVNVNPKPIFYPLDSVYSASTAPAQSPYTIDLRIFYKPSTFGRSGLDRFIRFTNCIVISVPTGKLSTKDNGHTSIATGVVSLAGGLGFEDDGITPLTGFGSDGTSPITDQATLNNFIHIKPKFELIPDLNGSNPLNYLDIEYTFKPNLPVLQNKELITLGCNDAFSFDRDFINGVFAGDIALRTQQLQSLVINNSNFPNPLATQQCMAAALDAFRSDITTEGVANLQTTMTLCLQKLKDDTNTALSALIGLGAEPCKSSYSLEPKIQFTSEPIIVSVNINERNGQSIITGLPPIVATDISNRIKPYATFGQVDHFTYDGYGIFTANLTSASPGLGELMIAFDDNIFCDNVIPTDLSIAPTHTLKQLAYEFIYTPSLTGGVKTGEDDTDGSPRRDSTDLGTS